jgi:hypothetical protein
VKTHQPDLSGSDYVPAEGNVSNDPATAIVGEYRAIRQVSAIDRDECRSDFDHVSWHCRDLLRDALSPTAAVAVCEILEPHSGQGGVVRKASDDEAAATYCCFARSIKADGAGAVARHNLQAGCEPDQRQRDRCGAQNQRQKRKRCDAA